MINKQTHWLFRKNCVNESFNNNVDIFFPFLPTYPILPKAIYSIMAEAEMAKNILLLFAIWCVQGDPASWCICKIRTSCHIEKIASSIVHEYLSFWTWTKSGTLWDHLHSPHLVNLVIEWSPSIYRAKREDYIHVHKYNTS